MRAPRILPLLLALSACESDPLTTVVATLDVRASADAAQARTVNFEVENRGPHTAYVVACDQRVMPVMETRENGAWLTPGAILGCQGNADPVALRPGETAEGVVTALGVGDYRVAVLVSAEPELETQRLARSSAVTVAP